MKTNKFPMIAGVFLAVVMIVLIIAQFAVFVPSVPDYVYSLAIVFIVVMAALSAVIGWLRIKPLSVFWLLYLGVFTVVPLVLSYITGNTSDVNGVLYLCLLPIIMPLEPLRDMLTFGRNIELILIAAVFLALTFGCFFIFKFARKKAD